MDIDSIYKNLKADHEMLSIREQELRNRINDIKRLHEMVIVKKKVVTELEQELTDLLITQE